MSSCRTPEKKLKALGSSLGSCSPQTPTKIGIRKGQVKREKDSCCLCCGINLYGAGSTYNLLTHDGLAEKISQLILQTIDVERQSCRICKSCFRRVESLDKKSTVLKLELECFRSKHSNTTGSTLKTDEPSAISNESFVKRLAKIPLSSAPRKRSKVCEKLFASGIEDSDTILMSVSPLNDENPQENRESETNSAFHSSVEVSYVYIRKENNQNNVERQQFNTFFSFFKKIRNATINLLPRGL